MRTPAVSDWLLVLSFEAGRAALSSRSYAGLAPPKDQTPAFAALARTLLAVAAEAAPRARFLRAAPAALAGLYWAITLLVLGAGAALLTAFERATAGLAIDIAARLVFAALVIACALPWLADESRRGFDPRNLPPSVLPSA